VSSAGAYLLWDAAFAELVHDAPPLPDPSALYERCITLGTFSKAYGLAGLRIGWCIGPPEVLDWCIRLRDYITLYLSPLVEVVAERAVRHASALLDARLPQARTNLQLVERWIDAHQAHVTWVRPRGGVSTFVRLAGIPDVTEFCRELAESQKVLLVPGECFGDRACVRLGFGSSTASVQEGLRRISTSLTAESIGRHDSSIERITL
jgi:aspartate/methionine/tyrosine aminotransferase